MITIQEHNEAKETLNRIKEGQEEFNKNSNTQMREIKDKYYKLKRKLDDQEYKEVNEMEKTTDQINEKYEMQKENSLCVESEFNQIIKLMEIEEKWRYKSLPQPVVYYYDYLRNDNGYRQGDKIRMFYQIESVLVEDDFKKIYLYITKNDKPKNCISLCAIGNSKFTDKLIKKFPYSYGVDAHTDKANIRTSVKDFPTEEEARDYIKRNSKRILKDFLEEHTKMEELYNEVIPQTKTKEWKLALLNHKKKYQERCVSNGTESEEYKEILKQIKEVEDE